MEGVAELSVVEKKKVLFLCTGNACRSQMAEGWSKALIGDVVDVYSAGIETHGVNPSAVAVMAEAGVDVSGQYSKHVDELLGVRFDLVITVCDNASQSCPSFTGAAKIVHIPFDDPPALAQKVLDGEAKLACYRRVRDEIRDSVKKIPDLLAG